MQRSYSYQYIFSPFQTIFYQTNKTNKNLHSPKIIVTFVHNENEKGRGEKGKMNYYSQITIKKLLSMSVSSEKI